MATIVHFDGEIVDLDTAPPGPGIAYVNAQVLRSAENDQIEQILSDLSPQERRQLAWEVDNAFNEALQWHQVMH